MADTTPPSVNEPILALAQTKPSCLPKREKKLVTGICVDSGKTVSVELKKSWFSWRSAATPAQPASAAAGEGEALPVVHVKEADAPSVTKVKLVQPWRYSCYKSNGMALPGALPGAVAAPVVASPVAVASPVRKWFFSSCVSSVNVSSPEDRSVASPVVPSTGSVASRGPVPRVRFCRPKKSLPATPLAETTLAVREPSSVPGEVLDQDPSKPVAASESQ